MNATSKRFGVDVVLSVNASRIYVTDRLDVVVNVSVEGIGVYPSGKTVIVYDVLNDSIANTYTGYLDYNGSLELVLENLVPDTHVFYAVFPCTRNL